MNKKAKKSKTQKKILIVSVILAVFIVAGGTFAWFTSKDEVTNKLTASNNYGVSIVESFSAPDNWVPGQEVNKDVYAANTGNIDAFVKTSISSAMELTTEGAPVDFDINSTIDVSNLVELGKSTEGSMVDEVKAVQAGGRLAYSVTADGETLYDESKSSVGTDYAPENTGLYIFERSLGDDASEYTGYYYDADGEKYYALASVTVVTDDNDAITGFTAALRTTETASVSDSDLIYDFTNIQDTADPLIVVTYKNGTDTDTTDDVIINIHLAANWADEWTWNKNEKAFYYNDTLKAGEATEKLIDSLELDENVTEAAYVNLEYDLTITTESVQVTTDANGDQTADAVEWTLEPSLTLSEGKITAVSWSEP